MESLCVRWVNAPSRVAQAEYKPKQLKLAQDAGLTVPPTLISSRPDDVAAFATEINHPIITKALYARIPRDSRGFPIGALYAAEVPLHKVADPSISATAHLFQAKLDRDYDVRLTVVHNQLFAAALRGGGDDGHLDWRKNHRKIAYQVCRTPDAVADGVLRFMRLLGLDFGALDFIVTRDGQWVFLEVNPNGQWFWIESQTGLAISVALANLLKEPL